MFRLASKLRLPIRDRLQKLAQILLTLTCGLTFGNCFLTIEIINLLRFNLTPLCENKELENCVRYEAVHEFGHVLGFQHEHKRSGIFFILILFIKIRYLKVLLQKKL